MWHSVFHDSERLVEPLQNSNDRIKLFHVGLCSLEDLGRVEGRAVHVVAAEGHHLAAVVAVVKHACVRHETTLRVI